MLRAVVVRCGVLRTSSSLSAASQFGPVTVSKRSFSVDVEKKEKKTKTPAEKKKKKTGGEEPEGQLGKAQEHILKNAQELITKHQNTINSSDETEETQTMEEITEEFRKVISETFSTEDEEHNAKEMEKVIDGIYSDLCLQIPEIRIDKQSAYLRGIKANKLLKENTPLYAESPLVSVAATQLSSIPSDSFVPLKPSDLCKQCNTPLFHKTDPSTVSIMMHPSGSLWSEKGLKKEFEEAKQEHLKNDHFCTSECSHTFQKNFKTQSDFIKNSIDHHNKRLTTLSTMQDVFPLMAFKIASRTMADMGDVSESLAASDIQPVLSHVPVNVSKCTPAHYATFKRLISPVFDSLKENKAVHISISSLFNQDWFERTFRSLQSNVIRVTLPIFDQKSDSEMSTTLGFALYGITSFLNHSCDPNVEIDFMENNNMLTLHTLKRIRKDEELFISYIDTDLPVNQRQQALYNRYGFQCRCPRCLSEDPDLQNDDPSQDPQ